MPRVRGRFIEAPRDANQTATMQRYRDFGCSVEDLGAVGNGVPDLLVGCAGITDVAEVKMPGEELRPSQQTFIARWRGSSVWKIWTLDDVEAHVKDMRRRARLIPPRERVSPR
jgi:hypothetical protein